MLVQDSEGKGLEYGTACLWDGVPMDQYNCTDIEKITSDPGQGAFDLPFPRVE